MYYSFFISCVLLLYIYNFISSYFIYCIFYIIKCYATEFNLYDDNLLSLYITFIKSIITAPYISKYFNLLSPNAYDYKIFSIN